MEYTEIETMMHRFIKKCHKLTEEMGIKSTSEFAKGYDKGFERGIEVTLEMIKAYAGD